MYAPLGADVTIAARSGCGGYPVDGTAYGGGAKADHRGDSHSGEMSTVAVSLDSSSERSSSAWQGRHKFVPWDDLRLGHRIQPYCGYAHNADDVYLLSEMLDLVRLQDVDGETVKLCLRALKFLHLCDYSDQDICSIMSHATAYFMDAYALCGNHMDSGEVGNVLVSLMFIAHCYVQDETCPLHIWHQHLFRRYCPLRTLNSAIIRLLEIRRFILRLDERELSDRFERLNRAIQRSRYGASQQADHSGHSASSGGYPSNAGSSTYTPMAANAEDGACSQRPLLSQVLEHFKYQSVDSLWKTQDMESLRRPEQARSLGAGRGA